MDITAIMVRDWSFGGLLALCVVLILLGKLTPRSVLDDMITDRDRWRSLTEKLTLQVDELITLTRATNATLQLIQAAHADHPHGHAQRSTENPQT